MRRMIAARAGFTPPRGRRCRAPRDGREVGRLGRLLPVCPRVGGDLRGASVRSCPGPGVGEPRRTQSPSPARERPTRSGPLGSVIVTAKRWTCESARSRSPGGACLHLREEALDEVGHQGSDRLFEAWEVLAGDVRVHEIDELVDLLDLTYPLLVETRLGHPL